MRSSENSHNGQSTNGSLKLPVGWFERIVLSCDFFCCALWRGGNGCEIALCQLQEAENVPTIPQVSLSMTAINLLSDKSRFWFSLCEFCLKKKKLQLIIQFSSVYFVTVWSWNLHVKKNKQKTPQHNKQQQQKFFCTSAHVTQIFRHLTTQSSDCIKALMLKTKIVLWCSALCKPRAEHLRGITMMREQLYFNYSLSNCCAMLTTAAAW